MPSKFIPKSNKRLKLAVDSKGTEREIAPDYKVVVCVPCGDMVCAGFAFDLSQLIGFTIARAPNIEISLVFHKSSILPQSRTVLANQAVSTPGASHILWLDSDMRFKKDTLLRLLSYGEKIVGANYPTRSEPVLPVAFEDVEGTIRHYTETDETALCEVVIAGMGCLLVDVDVFRGIEKPWFQLGYCEETDSFQGEDVFFLLKARDAGYKVFIDPVISREIAHLGEYEYNNETALGYREAMRKNG